MNATQKVE